MAISGLVHVNINCSNFERSKAFYEVLGFKEVWQVPETNTAEVAAAVGMPPYNVKGALFRLHGPAVEEAVTIDLLEWIKPRDETAPYPHLYHLGIARIALATTDLDSDMEKLKSVGAQFLSKPATMPPSSGVNARFVCFKDPDGTILELVETKVVSGLR